ncbi:hypothetical protein SERLA73DRAFT_158399 [Serpula lacrymans var. lacrymans S7.3]|uniref:WW domain-containing protein n=1 Tax=Serpula lacrymans var. lacrymans (strain S7.3) TaxID=936435 RepID=F8PL90_SERL3|nr:hypothetical protein SERLA73DRAFT_158399 [Serpula lacrymans var. lacrymans S7.3]
MNLSYGLHNGPNGAVAVAPARLIAQPNGDRPGTPVLVFESSIPEVHPLLTMHASEQRYGMTHKISTDQQSHEIPALQLSYPEHDGALPPEWTKPLQPEGACYFMHKERRIFTHADICDPDVLDDIINLADHIQKELQCQLSSDYHNEIELVIEPRTGKNDALVGLYYFVDPRNQCVFWLENCDGSPFLNECKGVRQLSHKKLAVTAQYWKHWELFPNLCHVSEDILEELKNMLLQARCDHIMSEESTAPLNAEVLSQLFDIVNNIKLTGNPNLSVYRAWIVGRIMHEFARNQFLNFYGQKCARLGVLQSIYGEDLEQRSWKMSVLSHALFGAPKVHVEALHKLYVDGIACTFTWKRFMENLNSEVQDFNLLASVLLNANVGFLAIQSVDNGSGANDNARSLTQIASYLSLVASVGSIVLGLVLVRHTRTKKNDSADKTANFLRHMKHNQFGQETLAVIYSLPYALLMWGMLLFLAAFSFECYKPADDLSRLLVGITSLAVGLLVIWCIVALRAGLNGRDADWRNFVPRRVQKILDREVTGQDMEDDNGSQLSVISRLWQFASLGKAVRAQSSQDPDIELAAAGSNSGVHCTLRVRAATGDSVPSSEVEA